MSEPGTTPTPPTEADLAIEERALKQEEFAARREKAKVKLAATTAPWWRGADPLVLAVVAGVFTLAGNTYLAYYNARATIAQETIRATDALKQEEKKAADDLELEREKAKATLILQAVSTSDPAAARRNLLFFLDGGLIKDEDQKIHNALEKYAPVLPSASGQPTRTPPTTPESYNDAFWSANLRPEWVSQLDASLEHIIARSRDWSMWLKRSTHLGTSLACSGCLKREAISLGISSTEIHLPVAPSISRWVTLKTGHRRRASTPGNIARSMAFDFIH
jgi:hypothetical protein